MKNPFIFVAALVLLDAVIVGAFGAHTLKSVLSESSLASFETGVRYQFYHGLGLLFLGLTGSSITSRMKLAGWIMLVGILFFSGSIYLLSCKDWLGIENAGWLGPITPVGGILFIVSWLLIAIEGLKWKG